MPDILDQERARRFMMQQMMLQARGVPSPFGTLPTAMPQPMGAFMGGFGQRYEPIFQPQYFTPPRQFWGGGQGFMGLLSAGLGLMSNFLAPAMRARGISPVPSGMMNIAMTAQEERQQQTLGQIGIQAQRQDASRIQEVLSNILLNARPEARQDAQLSRRITETSADVANRLQRWITHPIAQMMGVPALLEQMGISIQPTAMLGQAAFLGARSMATPITAERATGIAEAIMRQYYTRLPGGGIRVNQQFARGMTTQDMGQMLMTLGQHGMLDPNNTRQIVGQIGELNQTMEIMRQLVGDPNAGFQQLFRTMQAVTGGAFGQLRQPEVRRMVSQLQTVSQAMGIAPQQAGQFMRAAAVEAEARGLLPVMGARAGLEAMMGEAAGRRADVAAGVTRQPRLGALTQQQRVEMARREALATRTSRYGIGVGILTMMRRDAEEQMRQTPEGREVLQLLDQRAEGTITPEGTRRLRELTRPGNLQRIGRLAGFRPEEVRSMQGDVWGAMIAFEETTNPEAEARARAEAGVERMARQLERGAAGRLREFGITENRQIERVIQASIERGGTLEATREAVREALRGRGTEADVRMIAGGVLRTARAVYPGRPRALEEYARLYSRRAVAERGGLMAVSRLQEEVADIMAEEGVRPVRAGTLGQNIIRGIVDILGSEGEETTLAKALMRASGMGVETRRLQTVRERLQEPLAGLRERAQRATGAERTRLQRSIEAREQAVEALDRWIGEAKRETREGTQPAEEAKDLANKEKESPSAVTAKEKAREAARAEVDVAKTEDKAKAADSKGGKRPIQMNITQDAGTEKGTVTTSYSGEVVGI